MSDHSASLNIDQICDRFEQAWLTGNPVSIEVVLQEHPTVDRRQLLEELIPVEAHHRVASGQSVKPQDYSARFPEVSSSLPELLRDSLPANPSWQPSDPSSPTHLERSTKENAAVPPASQPIRGLTLPAAGHELGPYRLIKQIGAGGMGTVWEAIHIRLEKRVALKLLAPHLMSDPTVISRFDREIKAVGKLEHRHLVQAYDAGRDGDVHYLAMEYIDGMDMARYVSQRGPMSVKQAINVLIQATEGLAEAHRANLIHRDIKPANLMINRKGVVKVMDLGLARIQSNAGEPSVGQLTSMGQMLGTPDFMAPEQWDDTHAVDGRCDLYALGCTLFYLMTGVVPYRQQTSLTQKMYAHLTKPAPDLAVERQSTIERLKNKGSPSEILKNAAVEIPDELLAIYRKLLAKDPNQRYATADELLRALKAVFATLSQSTTAISKPEPTIVADRPVVQTTTGSTKKSKSEIPLARISAAILALLVVIGGGFLFQRSKLATPVEPNEKTNNSVVVTARPSDSPSSQSPEHHTNLNAFESRNSGLLNQRQIAEAFLRAKAHVGIVFGNGAKEIQPSEPLPTQPFVIGTIRSVHSSEVGGDHTELLRGLPFAAELRFCNANLDRSNVEALSLSTLWGISIDEGAISNETLDIITRSRDLRFLNTRVSEPLSAKNWQQIATMPGLRYLSLSPGQGANALANNRPIRTLALDDCATTADLESLPTMPNLRELYLWNHRLGDDVLPSLRQAVSLRCVHLSGLVSSSAVEQLQRERPDLLIFHPASISSDSERETVRWIRDQGGQIDCGTQTGDRIEDGPAKAFVPWSIRFTNDQPIDDGIEILSNLRYLDTVNIARLNRADDAARILAKLVSLKHVAIDAKTLTGNGMKTLATLPDLEQLYLTGTNPEIRPHDWAFLSKVEWLSNLTVYGYSWESESFGQLAKLSRLGILQLTSCEKLRSADVATLHSLHNLRMLDIQGLSTDATAGLTYLKSLRTCKLGQTELSAELQDRLHAALPHCAIFHKDGLIEPEPITTTSDVNPAELSIPTPLNEERRQLELAKAVVKLNGYISGVAAGNPPRGFGIYELAEVPKSSFLIGNIHMNSDNSRNWSESDTRLLRGQGYIELYAPGHSPIDDRQIDTFVPMTLRGINLTISQVTDRGIRELAKNHSIRELLLPQLTDLSAETWKRLGENRDLRTLMHARATPGCEALAGCTALRSSSASVVSHELFEALKQLPHLRSLHFPNLELNEEPLQQLLESRSLRRVGFGPSTSAEMAARLQAARPELIVMHPSISSTEGERQAIQWARAAGASWGGRLQAEDTWEAGPTKSVWTERLHFSADRPAPVDFQPLKGLRYLELVLVPQLEHADQFAKAISSIESVSEVFIAGHSLTSEGLSHLGSLPELESLDFLNNPPRGMSDDAWNTLAKCQFLWYLNLTNSTIGNEGLAALGKLPSLQKLHLTSCPNISSEGIRGLASLKSLAWLDLPITQIDDGAIPALSQIRSLRFVNLYSTKVTHEGIEKLRSALPHCAIIHPDGTMTMAEPVLAPTE